MKFTNQITNMESDLAKDTERIKDFGSEVQQQSVRVEHLATEATKPYQNLQRHMYVCKICHH